MTVMWTKNGTKMLPATVLFMLILHGGSCNSVRDLLLYFVSNLRKTNFSRRKNITIRMNN